MAGSGLAEVMESLEKFKSVNLDVDMVNSAWNGNLCDVNDLPDDLLELHCDTNWAVVLREAACSIRDYCTGGPEVRGVDEPLSDVETSADSMPLFWVSLPEHAVSYKGVIVIVSCLLDRSASRMAAYADYEISVNAASLYLCLVCIPGSKAFRIFTPVLFQKALQILNKVGYLLSCLGPCERRPWSKTGGKVTARSPGHGLVEEDAVGRCALRGAGRSDSGAEALPKCGKRGGNMGSKRRAKKIRHQDIIDDDAAEFEDGFDDAAAEDSDAEANGETDSVFSMRETQSLIDVMSNFTSDLIVFLKRYSLKDSTHSIEYLAHQMADLFAAESRFQSCDLERLIADARSALKELCSPFHGPVDSTVCTVLKHLQPVILSFYSRHAISFVCQLVGAVPDGGALPGIICLLQNLCFKVADRADARAKLCTAIFSVAASLPAASYADIVKWLLQFSCSGKVSHRMFTLELFSLLLGKPHEVHDPENVPAEKRRFLLPECLLKVVLDRCSDKASGVRAKALSILATMCGTVTSASYLSSPMYRLFSRSASLLNKTGLSTAKTWQSEIASGAAGKGALAVREGDVGGRVTTCTPDVSRETGNSELCDCESTWKLLRCRAYDAKVHVRRTALLVLRSIMDVDCELVVQVNVAVFVDHCRDPSLLVRKQAMQSLSDLVQRYPCNEHLQQAWVEGVLPMIGDSETSVQMKCIDLVDEILFRNIAHARASRGNHSEMSWKMLNIIAHSQSRESWRFLRRVIFMLASSKKLRSDLAVVLKTHIETEDNAAAAWMLLTGVAQCCCIKNPDFVWSYFEKHQTDGKEEVLRYVLIVLGCVSKSFDDARISSIMGHLFALLMEFQLPPLLISEIVTTMSMLGQSDDGDDEDATSQRMLNTCSKKIMKCSEKYLSSVILSKKSRPAQIDEGLVIRHLVTVGEFGLHCPQQTSKRIFLLLKSFLAIQASGNDDVPYSDKAKSCQPIDSFIGSVFSSNLRRVAFVSLGKLCLQHEALAKECVPAFGKEIELSDDPVLRNNVIVMMADLCKRYATLVEEYIPVVTACLRDSSLMVRRQTLIVLTNLLQEDYLKWRGPLFFQYLTVLVDESAEIQSFVEYGLLHILNKRHPNMFSQHFLECLFYFNEYKGHNKYNVASSKKDPHLLSMSGDKMKSKRSMLYKFLLDNMSDEHRFEVATRLCQDVLGGAVDGSIALKLPDGSTHSSGHDLLKDALFVLCCDEIKLTSLRSVSQEDIDDDVAAAVVATAKKSIITQVLKKNAIENIIPIIISLKHKLEKLRSPLIRDLMIYLKELMKDYKNEVKEMLASDKQLATEIEYDVRRFQQEQLSEAQAELTRERRFTNTVHKEPRVVLRRFTDADLTALQGGRAPDTQCVDTEAIGNVDGIGAANARMDGDKQNVEATQGNDGLATSSGGKGGSDAGHSVRNEAVAGTLKIQNDGSPPFLGNIGGTTEQASKDVRRDVNSGGQRQNVSVSKESSVDARMPMIRLPRVDAVRNTNATTKSREILLRAISTPRSVISDITFDDLDCSTSIKSLSPIRLAELNKDQENLQKVVLHLDSPVLKHPHPKWSLVPSCKKLSLQEAVDE